MTDEELMRAYVRGDAGALGELVRRHVDFVHGVASREAGKDADDVTQAVFLLLARKAKGLQGRASIAGWLFTAARLCARNARRAERRRRTYERAAAMSVAQANVEMDAEMVPLLNEAIAALGAEERELVVLRHLENRELSEIAGGLGISVAAATKRVQRAVEKMRIWFGRRGKMMSVGGVTGVLAAAALHKAPAALAMSVGSGTAGSAGAVAIAKSAGVSMAFGPMKIFAAALVVIVAVGVTGAAVLIAHQDAGAKDPVSGETATSSVAPVQEEAPALGEPTVVCFDMLVEKGVAEELRGAMVKMSETNGYAGYRGSSERVMAILEKSVEQHQQISPEGPYMRWGVADNLNTVFSERVNALRVSGLSNVSELGNPTATPTPRGMNLTIHKQVKISTMEDAGAWQSFPGEIQFGTEALAGESVVFFGEAGAPAGQPLEHVMVWQVFRALPDQREAFASMYDVKQWLRMGPAGMRMVADRSLVWRNGAMTAENAAPAAFVKKLANGAEVKLMAVTRPVETKLCWWSAVGERVNIGYGYWYVPTELPLAVMLGWHVPMATKVQGNHWEYNEPGVVYIRSDGGELITSARDAASGVDVGIATGAWTDAGDVPLEGMLDAGEVQVMMREVKSYEKGTVSAPLVEVQAPVEVEVRVLAVDKFGVRVWDRNAMNVGLDGNWPGVHLGKPRAGALRRLQLTMKIARGDIDHFVVQTRKVEWARFEGFATEPKEKVPELTDAGKMAEIRAAAEKLRLGAQPKQP